MSALAIEDLRVAYGPRPVLRGVTLQPIPAGSVTALVGPNAAGKSTLLRAICGFLPFEGKISLGGDDLHRMDRTHRSSRIGFMPQTIPPGIGLTVFESVLTAIKAAPFAGLVIPAAEARAQAVAVLEELGILGLGAERLDALSGGQRQLASLAQATARRPALILLDEPTSALDLRHQMQVMLQARRLAAEGRTVVVVLHDLAVAARWADRLVVLQQGRCHAEGPPRAVLTPALLAEVYGVAARVETCSRGQVTILCDDLEPLP